jgi:hypothetical protein
LTTLRSDADVLIVGSSLGGLVAATYLARAGLRVILLEEEAHRKRPPVLREPFLLPGLGADGPVRRVLRELALPLIDQREIREEDIAVQVILPEARIDVRTDPGALGAELEAYGLCPAEAATGWFEALGEAAEEVRRLLWEEPAPPRGSIGGSVGSTFGSSLTRRLQKSVSTRTLVPPRIEGALPAPPEGAGPLISALIAALTGGDGSGATPAPSFLLEGACSATLRMPHSGTPFLDLFRRRLRTLHGEIWSAEEFGLLSHRGDVGVELGGTRCFARALLVAVPRDPLRRFLDETGEAPPWLQDAPPVALEPAALFRAERASLPVGLATRVVVADRNPLAPHCLSFNPDPTHSGVEWLVASGPGAGTMDPERPLGDLAPFSSAGVVRVDPGPSPRWDLDQHELRFPSPEAAAPIRHRAPVAVVGPELSSGMGPEGEILQARQVAIRLANRLVG